MVGTMQHVPKPLGASLSTLLLPPKSDGFHVVFSVQFYCKGEVASLWRAAGYEKVVHECRDFYADVAAGTVPAYDVLVTNPP
jgi:hypothetical protein